jgi:hypothetical protein
MPKPGRLSKTVAEKYKVFREYSFLSSLFFEELYTDSVTREDLG